VTVPLGLLSSALSFAVEVTGVPEAVLVPLELTLRTVAAGVDGPDPAQSAAAKSTTETRAAGSRASQSRRLFGHFV